MGSCGLYGESKYQIYGLLSHNWTKYTEHIPHTYCTSQGSTIELEQIEHFPIFAKPDKANNAMGATAIQNKESLQKLLKLIDGVEYLIQEYVYPNIELGVYVKKDPSRNTVDILSVTRKHIHEKGITYAEVAKTAPVEFKESIVSLFKEAEGLYYGRFDILVPLLENNEPDYEHYKIAEFNLGPEAIAVNAYDEKKYSYRERLRILRDQWKHAFEIRDILPVSSNQPTIKQAWPKIKEHLYHLKTCKKIDRDIKNLSKNG